MRILTSAVIGAGAGGLLSVAPFELFFLVFVGAVGAALVLAVRSRALVPLFAQVVAAGVVMSIAHDAHTKFIDHPIEKHLSAPTLTVTHLRAELGVWADPEDAARVDDRIVLLPSIRPTRREIDQALAPLGLELHISYCGNGSSILWGAHPMGSGLIRARDPKRDAPRFRLAVSRVGPPSA